MVKKHPLLENELYAFAIGIKAFDGAIQLAVGVIIFVLGPHFVNGHLSNIVTELADRELFGDRAIIDRFVWWAQNLTPHSTRLIALYLVAHGVVKLILVAALWTHRSWGPSIAGLFLLIILAYELQQIYLRHSILLSLAAAMDFAIVVLIGREYLVERKMRAQPPSLS